MEKIVEGFSVNFMDAEDNEIERLEQLSHVLAGNSMRKFNSQFFCYQFRPISPLS